MGASTRVCGVRNSSSGSSSSRTIGHWLRDRCGCRCAMQVGDAVSTCCRPVGVGVVPPEGFRVAILTSSGLGDVRHNLHTSRDCTSRAATAGSVSRGSRSSKAFSELLDKSHGNIVGSNVHGISNAKDNERPFSRQRKTSVRGVQTSTRSLLNLADTDTGLSNDRTDEDMRD